MAPPATVRRAPYKDFLQPALHRRFASTAAVLLLVSYFEAVLLGDWKSYIWSWFPIGPAGVRTFFLFCSGLTVLTLRVAQYHVGTRTSKSAFDTFLHTAPRLQTLETLICYTLSSLLFLPIFLWAASESANLNWITYYSGDRARLNEKPIFLSCYLISTAVLAAGAHLFKDVDELKLGALRQGDKSKETSDERGAVTLIWNQIPQILSLAILRSVAAALGNILIYRVLLRSAAWRWSLFFFRPFYNLPKTNMLPPTWPEDIWTLCRCMYAGFLVSLIWIAGNNAFSVFMVREPLKNGKPLTSESKDPNGSLLNGLKSKKLSVQAFALWELAYIARDFEARRTAIYEDIDRKDGPMWSQIYVICLNIIKGIETRIDDFEKKPEPPKEPDADEKKEEEKRKRVTAPLKDEKIYEPKSGSGLMSSEVSKVLGKVARSPGHSPASQLSPLAKKTFRTARDKVLSKEQQEAMAPEKLAGRLHQLAQAAFAWPYPAGLFRHEFRRRLTAVALGGPYAEVSIFVNAAAALGLLAAHSLAEDKFGNVHRDVPAMVRTLTGVVRKLEGFRERLPVHWTDPVGNRTTPEVDEVLGALKESLGLVVEEFEPYAADLRLTMKDVRLAKEAAKKPEEEAPAVKAIQAAKRPGEEEPVLTPPAMHTYSGEMEQIR